MEAGRDGRTLAVAQAQSSRPIDLNLTRAECSSTGNAVRTRNSFSRVLFRSLSVRWVWN